MTPADSGRMIAMARLRERSRRIGRMRRTVIAGGAATFMLAWGLALNDQLAHGTSTKASNGKADRTTTPVDDGTVVESTDEGLVVVPATPAPSTSTPAPAPAPAPVQTSQS
jgi:hypothetical protein